MLKSVCVCGGGQIQSEQCKYQVPQSSDTSFQTTVFSRDHMPHRNLVTGITTLFGFFKDS